jgi:hypothetical protein
MRRIFEMKGNTFENKLTILSELWSNYREDEELKDFIEFNDLGLPLAYFIKNKIVISTKESENYVNETYDLFIATLTIEDKAWVDLDEILGLQT